jgi:hypothetical protein
MRRDRIYPVAIKPKSAITTWGGWPDDVRDLLHVWNRYASAHSLSFRRSGNVFKCMDCEQFCEPAESGAAVLDGDWLCDDCLIQRARANTSRAGIAEQRTLEGQR